ncbi:putative AC9 transposase [Folsomia candida]|uniref:Putative AC9 transposase n=1 Tax=Folsomia candida TaxID=158441 RepID=A0A226D5A9_FOLCA|nr:putative AC9 transposase [Folsomia candida]
MIPEYSCYASEEEDNPERFEESEDNDLFLQFHRSQNIKGNEIARYLSQPVISPNALNNGALGWWKNHESDYPTLSKMARDFLTAAGAGVPVERLFSSGSTLLTPKRQKMSPSTIQECARIYLSVSVCYVIFQIVLLRSSPAHLSEKVFPATLTCMYAICTVTGAEWGADMASIQLMNLIYKTGGTEELAMIFLLILFPCQPPFLGWVILPECDCTRSSCSPNPFFFLIVKAALILAEFAQIFRHLVNGSHYAMYVVIAGILHLWEESAKIVGSPRFTRRYRKLQILEVVLNFAIRDKVFPTFLVSCPSMQILATFVCIKYHDGMAGTHLIFLALLSLDTEVLNVIYCTAAGVVYEKSETYLKGLKGLVRGKEERKMLKSYTPLRVRFGSNFMDRLTPLVIQQFCAIQTMNLLLLR